MDAEKLRLAEIIDAWVQNIARQSSSDAQADEQMLEGMHEYMEPFKQLLDTCTRLEMNLLVQRYDGFYRFANLLERLAQTIQDGVITVPTPPGRGKQARQQRTRKPKPNRRQNTQQIRRPITFLPTFTEFIIGELAQTEEQYVSFAAARHKPYVLDDALVERAMKVYTEQLAFIPLHEQQFHWWLSENITDAQRHQVKDLLARLPALRAKTEALLALLAELKPGVIDRILEMSDEALGQRFLRGEEGKLPGGE